MNNKLRKSWMRKWRLAHKGDDPTTRRYRIERAPVSGRIYILKNDGRALYQSQNEHGTVVTKIVKK